MWIIVGALYGVLLRFIFGLMPDSFRGAMSVAFLIGTPIAIGALTIYGARHRNPSVAFMIFCPWATIALMLLGCAISLLEGIICIAILSPLFLICASIGGVAMGVALRVSAKHSNLRAVAALPLLLILSEGQIPLEEKDVELRQSVLVAAAPSTIWNQILNARSIQPQELPFNIPHFIGVPKPVEGVNVQTSHGEVRYSKWERGVNFRADVTNRTEFKSISWRYSFNSHSFPEGSMDEHVAVGGRYFDLHDTTFNLIPLSTGSTKLEIIAHYRINSSINFYSVPVSKFLGQDFIHSILILYKDRSERADHA